MFTIIEIFWQIKSHWFSIYSCFGMWLAKVFNFFLIVLQSVTRWIPLIVNLLDGKDNFIILILLFYQIIKFTGLSPKKSNEAIMHHIIGWQLIFFFFSVFVVGIFQPIHYVTFFRYEKQVSIFKLYCKTGKNSSQDGNI